MFPHIKDHHILNRILCAKSTKGKVHEPFLKQIVAQVRPPLLIGNASVAGFGAFWSALNLGNIVYFVVCDLVNGKVHKYPEY